MKKIIITDNEYNQRLDKFLRKYLSDAPLSFLYKAIRKDVKVNGKRKSGEYILQRGDELYLYIKDEELKKQREKEEQEQKKLYDEELKKKEEIEKMDSVAGASVILMGKLKNQSLKFATILARFAIICTFKLLDNWLN